MSADFDGSTLDQAPSLEPKSRRMAVMWPETVPARDAPEELGGNPAAAATAVILACLSVGGVAAPTLRDAIAAWSR